MHQVNVECTDVKRMVTEVLVFWIEVLTCLLVLYLLILDNIELSIGSCNVCNHDVWIGWRYDVNVMLPLTIFH